MMYIHHLLISTLLFQWILTSPALYGGGCQQLDGILYQVGGSGPDPNNENADEIPVKESYSLNLKDGFKLKDSIYAPWEAMTGNKSPQAHTPGVVLHKPSKSIFMFGGMDVRSDTSFQVFDIENKKWSLNTKAVKGFYLDKLSTGERMNNSFYIATFNADDVNENKFYHYGGVVLDNQNKKAEARSGISVYDAKESSWTWPNDSGARIKSHTSQFYKGKLYILGGLKFWDDSLMPMDKVMIFDTFSLKWENKTIAGDLPSKRLGLSSVMIGSKLVIIGGSEDVDINVFPSSDLFYVDLKDDNLKWTKINIPGFTNSFFGCVSYFNNHLIYSFGYHADISKSTQIIDTKEWKLVYELPKLKEGDDGNASKSLTDKESTTGSNLNLPAIIGGSISGCIALILTIALVWYLTKRRNKPTPTQSPIIKSKPTEDMFIPAQPIHQPVWSQDKTGHIMEPSFSLSTDTQLPNFDDDLNMNYNINYDSSRTR